MTHVKLKIFIGFASIFQESDERSPFFFKILKYEIPKKLILHEPP